MDNQHRIALTWLTWIQCLPNQQEETGSHGRHWQFSNVQSPKPEGKTSGYIDY